MDFTRLDTQREFLQLRAKEDKTSLAYIDGRGPEPHDFLPNEKRLQTLLACRDQTPLEIVDAKGREYDEGVRPANITLGQIRTRITKGELTLYSTYEGYTEVKLWIGKSPLLLRE